MNKIIVFIINFYQLFLLKVFLNNRPGSCKFYPSCSEYAKQSFKQFDFISAFRLSLFRIFKCGPHGKNGGYDPVPSPKNFHT